MPDANRILVVDDEPKIRRFLHAGFEMHGYAVIEAGTGADALKAAVFNTPDLIILDLALSDMGGDEVLERIREWSNAPVIMLSIESRETEKVRLLKCGADDFVVKPFGMAELLARSEAALRRYERNTGASPVVISGPLAVDLATHRVTLDSHEIKLTRKEYQLLHILAANLGLIVTHGQLMTEMWTDDERENTHYLRILARRLRHKIEADPNHPLLLVTESGVGYRLSALPQRAPSLCAEPA